MESSTSGLAAVDYVVFAVYALVVLVIALGVSRRSKQSTEGYFLAGKSIPWWAVGASLIAANISAEQYIGMSGSGFVIGLGIASYEWMAAVTLILVGKFFLPIFIEKGIYTIPEFVEKRFNTTLKTILAVFWICLYIFVNLSSVLYLGGLALQNILGIGFMPAVIGLATFALVYSVFGGLSAVVWTDVIQVAVLVLGGIAISYFSVSFVGDGSFTGGFSTLIDKAPEHFDMVLNTQNPQYNNLPGWAVLIGGMWVANLYYWGFNQYIIQRTFAAKSVDEAQKGLVFAAYLKLITPFLICIPGIAAYLILNDPHYMDTLNQVFGSVHEEAQPSLDHADKAFPWLTTFLPVGVKGLVVAALTAAIVSSLASMMNSTATIFTMDIYKNYFGQNASDRRLVGVGRVTAIVALGIAIVIAPMLGVLDQAFQFIQEYTGLVSPGILAVFCCGLFYKKTTSNAAITGVLLSIVIALILKFVSPDGYGVGTPMPFMDQMFYTFVLTSAIIVFISLSSSENDDDVKAINTTSKTFATSGAFAVGSYGVLIITAVLYIMFW